MLDVYSNIKITLEYTGYRIETKEKAFGIISIKLDSINAKDDMKEDVLRGTKILITYHIS